MASPTSKSFRVLIYSWKCQSVTINADSEEAAVEIAEIVHSEGGHGFEWEDEGFDEAVVVGEVA